MLITIFSGLGFLLILKDIEILPAAGGLPVFICIAGLFWISFKLTRRSGSAETEITINDEGIQQIWKSQYLFSNKPDRRINWEEISEYLYQPESNYHLLKIKLLSGKTIKIYHSIWDHGKDDFSQLHIDFAEKIDQLNKRENKLDIKKGKNMYETKTALIVAIVLSTFVIASIILVIFLSSRQTIDPKSIIIILAGLGPILFFLTQVYIHRRERNESNLKDDND